jgi:hypothetical protein
LRKKNGSSVVERCPEGKGDVGGLRRGRRRNSVGRIRRQDGDSLVVSEVGESEGRRGEEREGREDSVDQHACDGVGCRLCGVWEGTWDCVWERALGFKDLDERQKKSGPIRRKEQGREERTYELCEG